MCDAELVSGMLGGNIAAAEKLIKKYKKDLLGFCTTKLLDTQLAQDCYQTTWEKAFRKLHTYDQGCSFGAWIFTICRNTVYDELRRKNAAMRGKTPAERHMLDVEYFETLIAEQKSTEQLAIEKDQRQRLLKSVYSLPEKYKDIIILRFFHSKTFSEISEMLCVAESTVKYRHNKAMELMKKMLGDDWYV